MNFSCDNVSAHYLELNKFEDFRGSTVKVFEQQDGKSFSQFLFSYTQKKNTFRGLHAQLFDMSEEKIIYCVRGELTWFAINFRDRNSPDWLKCGEFALSSEQAIYIPNHHLNGMLSHTNDVTLAILASRPFDSYSGVNVTPFGELFFQEQVEKFGIKSSSFDKKPDLVSQPEFLEKLDPILSYE